MNIDDEEKQQILYYLEFSEDYFYSLIPEYLPEYQDLILSPENLISIGKKYIEEHLAEVKQLICIEFDWPNRRKDPKFADKVNLAAILSDLVRIYLDLKIPPVIAAVLLIKIGLDKICRNDT